MDCRLWDHIYTLCERQLPFFSQWNVKQKINYVACGPLIEKSIAPSVKIIGVENIILKKNTGYFNNF